MKANIEIKEHGENTLFLHAEIGTFERGRVIASVPGNSIIIELKDGRKFEASPQSILDGIMEAIGEGDEDGK